MGWSASVAPLLLGSITDAGSETFALPPTSGALQVVTPSGTTSLTVVGASSGASYAAGPPPHSGISSVMVNEAVDREVTVTVDGGTGTTYVSTVPSSGFASTASAASGVEVTTISLPGGEVGAPYATTLTARGGAPPYTWTVPVSDGSLPPGLALSSDGGITGTPTTAEADTFTVEVTDSIGTTNTQPLSLTVSTAPLPSAPAGAILVGAAWGGAGTSPWELTVDVDGVTSGDELLVLWGAANSDVAVSGIADTFPTHYTWSTVFAEASEGTTTLIQAFMSTASGAGNSGTITLSFAAATQGGIFVYALHGMGAEDTAAAIGGSFPLATGAMAPSVSGEVLVTACSYVAAGSVAVMNAYPSNMPGAFEMAVAPVTENAPTIGPLLAATVSGINTGVSVAPSWSNAPVNAVTGAVLSILFKPS